ncbi:unnamed protein product, partial [Trichogramma brassicae]
MSANAIEGMKPVGRTRGRKFREKKANNERDVLKLSQFTDRDVQQTNFSLLDDKLNQTFAQNQVFSLGEPVTAYLLSASRIFSSNLSNRFN